MKEKIIMWLVSALWAALQIVSVKLVVWLTDPKKAAKARMANRERWWKYKRAAEALPDGRKKTAKLALATFLQIRLKFETSPYDAIARGDLNPEYPAQ